MAQYFHSGLDRLIVELSISHTDKPHSVELIWRNDQPVAKASTWQHTAFTRATHLCLPAPRRHSKQQSQQTSGGKPTPYTALLPRSTEYVIRIGFAQQEPLRGLTSQLVCTDSTMLLLLITGGNYTESLPFNTNNQKHYSRWLMHGCV